MNITRDAMKVDNTTTPPTKQPYGGSDNPHEAIKIIEHYNLNFALGNVIKYVVRDKGTDLGDYIKARDYLDREIKKLQDERYTTP